MDITVAAGTSSTRRIRTGDVGALQAARTTAIQPGGGAGPPLHDLVRGPPRRRPDPQRRRQRRPHGPDPGAGFARARRRAAGLGAALYAGARNDGRVDPRTLT